MSGAGEEPMVISELSDRDLNRAIAILMGWHQQQDGLWVSDDGDELEWFDESNPLTGWFPPYHASVDRLAPVEARLREAGGHVTIETQWRVRWTFQGKRATYEARADTEARARAEAAHQALTALAALNSPTPTAKGDA